jgi:hypothetical protein
MKDLVHRFAADYNLLIKTTPSIFKGLTNYKLIYYDKGKPEFMMYVYPGDNYEELYIRYRSFYTEYIMKKPTFKHILYKILTYLFSPMKLGFILSPHYKVWYFFNNNYKWLWGISYKIAKYFNVPFSTIKRRINYGD